MIAAMALRMRAGSSPEPQRPPTKPAMPHMARWLDHSIQARKPSATNAALAQRALPLEDGAVTRNKRALFIVITDYPAGAERVTMTLASELAVRPGWDVEVKIVCSQLADSFSKRTLPPNVKVTYGPAHSWH